MNRRIEVSLDKRSYPIVFNTEDKHALPRLIAREKPNRVFAIFDAQLYALHGSAILRSLSACGLPVGSFVLPLTESHKTMRTVTEVQEWLIRERISRSDLIIACGGGVTTDLVGFVAAITMRGIRWGAVPTTLVGMIDAAIGGKTGVNHERAKNAIGAFRQPRFVYTDFRMLQTLAYRQLYAGIGEMVKYAGLMGDLYLHSIQALLEKSAIDIRVLSNLIPKAVAYKADLVERDEFDTGVRRYLNLGHTFAHGIEHSLGYGKLLHGEAVGIGLLAACHLSGLHLRTAERQVAPFRRLVEHYVSGIPKRKLQIQSILESMNLDKKRNGKTMTFVMLKKPGKPVICTGISEGIIISALEHAIESYQTLGGSHGENPDY